MFILAEAVNTQGIILNWKPLYFFVENIAIRTTVIIITYDSIYTLMIGIFVAGFYLCDKQIGWLKVACGAIVFFAITLSAR